jgi:membrane-associated phospholipid phosphatase
MHAGRGSELGHRFCGDEQEIAPLLYWLADRASDAINPIFIVLILEEPLLNHGRQGEASRRGFLLFWARAALCIAVAVLLTELGKRYEVWPGHPNFPSGHMTFATAAATSLVLQRGRRWLWLVGPLALMMGLSLAYGHWHTPDEVLAGWVVGMLVPLGVWRLISRKAAVTAGARSAPWGRS